MALTAGVGNLAKVFAGLCPLWGSQNTCPSYPRPRPPKHHHHHAPPQTRQQTTSRPWHHAPSRRKPAAATQTHYRRQAVSGAPAHRRSRSSHVGADPQGRKHRRGHRLRVAAVQMGSFCAAWRPSGRQGRRRRARAAPDLPAAHPPAHSQPGRLELRQGERLGHLRCGGEGGARGRGRADRA